MYKSILIKLFQLPFLSLLLSLNIQTSFCSKKGGKDLSDFNSLLNESQSQSQQNTTQASQNLLNLTTTNNLNNLNSTNTNQTIFNSNLNQTNLNGVQINTQTIQSNSTNNRIFLNDEASAFADEVDQSVISENLPVEDVIITNPAITIARNLLEDQVEHIGIQTDTIIQNMNSTVQIMRERVEEVRNVIEEVSEAAQPAPNRSFLSNLLSFFNYSSPLAPLFFLGGSILILSSIAYMSFRSNRSFVNSTLNSINSSLMRASNHIRHQDSRIDDLERELERSNANLITCIKMYLTAQGSYLLGVFFGKRRR